jgi:hypothetical protein
MTSKIRHLPITDLARISTMEPPLRRMALMQVKSGGGGGSYRPTREKLADIVNRQPGVLLSKRAPWDIVEADLKKLSKSGKEETMNLLAAKAIYEHCTEEGINARELEGFPLTFSMGLKLTCWSPALFLYAEKATVPFFDMRRKYYLTPEAVRFMFSAMHIALRENNPDYEDVSFEIKRLSDTPKRQIRTITENDMRLFTYEELEDMVSQTQQLWIEVQQQRQEEQRKENDDWGDDSLFGTG